MESERGAANFQGGQRNVKKKKNPQKHVMDFEGRQRICQVENVKTFWAEEQLEQVERAGKVCVFWKTYGSSEG